MHDPVGRNGAVLGRDREADGLSPAGIFGEVTLYADGVDVGREDEAVAAAGDPGLAPLGRQGDVREPCSEVDPSDSGVGSGQLHAALGLDQGDRMRQHLLICRRRVEPAVESGGQDDVLRFSNLAEA